MTRPHKVLHEMNNGTTHNDRYWNISNLENNVKIILWDIKLAGLDVNTDKTKYISKELNQKQ